MIVPYLFRVQSEPSCLLMTWITDDHIEKGYAMLFADDSIFLAYRDFVAMLANEFHNVSLFSKLHTHKNVPLKLPARTTCNLKLRRVLHT